MKGWNQRILKIFDYVGRTWFIMGLLATVGCGLIGDNMGKWLYTEYEDHEEPIVYKRYQTTAEIGDYVTFTAVSAKIGGYTGSIDRIDHLLYGSDQPDFHGCLILTDADGNRIVSKKNKKRVASDLSSQMAALKALNEELNEWADQVNRSGGIDIRACYLKLSGGNL